MYGLFARLFTAMMMFFGSTVIVGLLFLAALDASRPPPGNMIRMGHSR